MGVIVSHTIYIGSVENEVNDGSVVWGMGAIAHTAVVHAMAVQMMAV